MQVEYKGSPPYWDYEVEGTKIKIGPYEVDIEKLRSDTEKIVDIKDEKGYFVASVIIPPNEYEYIDSGEKDEQGNPIILKKLKPVNMEKVKIIVWRKREEDRLHDISSIEEQIEEK